jgi:hypothetical protein
MEKAIIDFIDKIQFDPNDPPFANYHAFGHLQTGLFKLASEIRLEELKQQKEFSGFLFSIDARSNPKNDLLVCYFDWFSISLNNYLRLVALFDIMTKNNWKSNDIRTNGQEIKSYCTDYVKKIIPEILLWRNKVSAHFSATDPRSDNLGIIELSIFSFVTYRTPYYEIGGTNWSTPEGKSIFKRWSVTETFDLLTPRLWPHLKLSPLK